MAFSVRKKNKKINTPMYLFKIYTHKKDEPENNKVGYLPAKVDGEAGEGNEVSPSCNFFCSSLYLEAGQCFR